ncbi:MAG: hypothetical protein V1739_10135 [Candidatus Omnitrophota bacterium]
MRLKNIAVLAIISTCICLGYVKQQIEVVKLSYSLMDKEKRFSDLIDHNRVLLYNNTSLKAPQYLTGMIEQNELKLSLPDTASVAKVRVKRGQSAQLAKAAASSWKTRLWDVFVPKAQAAFDVSR